MVKADKSGTAADQSFPGEIVLPSLTAEQLASVSTFDEAVALFGADQLLDTADYGDGFVLLKDKSKLVGEPFIILATSIQMGDFGPFSIVKLITRHGDKYVFVDGSTGIKDQLEFMLDQTGRGGGWLCRNGLRVSNYTFTDESGAEKPASTYYIDTSPTE